MSIGAQITDMADAYFFGYGSLVNRATHDFDNAHRAHALGWRRIWRHTNLRPVAFLTAIPDPSSCIDGLMASVPNGDWGALDLRERAYERIAASKHVRHSLTGEPEVSLYSIPHGKHGAPDKTHPVLLSYIDVVTQGYLREFGEEGAARFFASTSGWEAPILDDRSEPIYSRHQSLTPDETGFVNDALRGLSAVVIEPQ